MVCAGRAGRPRGLVFVYAGQENFIAKTYDYVVSDMALTEYQLKQCGRCSLWLHALSLSWTLGCRESVASNLAVQLCRPVLQIPYGVNALGASHTLPGVPNGVLHLDAHALAGIYQCNITQWDHPAIVALNPTVRYEPSRSCGLLLKQLPSTHEGVKDFWDVTAPQLATSGH